MRGSPQKLFIWLCLAVVFSVPASAETTIYLVRHAEKAVDRTPDPALTPQGEERAEAIAAMLAAERLTAVYSTDLRRSRSTAAPAARAGGLAVTLYDPMELEALAGTLKARDGTFLVVGHSNTTPTLASLLSGNDLRYAGEDVYDLVYKVVLDAGEAKTIEVLRSSPVASYMSRIVTLRQRIADRLSVMTDVARYKWNHGMPVEAPTREANLLDATFDGIKQMELDEALANQAVAAQMAASKKLQGQRFETWQAEKVGKHANVPSLTEEVRPHIDVLTRRFLAALEDAEFTLMLCSYRGALLEPNSEYPDEIWQTAVQGVLPAGDCTPDSLSQD